MENFKYYSLNNQQQRENMAHWHDYILEAYLDVEWDVYLKDLHLISEDKQNKKKGDR